MKKIDWSIYENVRFAVLAFSGVLGWYEMGRPDTSEQAWKLYEATDARRKMMINFGMTITQTGRMPIINRA